MPVSSQNLKETFTLKVNTLIYSTRSEITSLDLKSKKLYTEPKLTSPYPGVSESGSEWEIDVGYQIL